MLRYYKRSRNSVPTLEHGNEKICQRVNLNPSDPSGVFTIFSRSCKFCWCSIKWCLVLGVLGAIGIGAYWWFELDNEIRAQVEAKLRNHYSPLGLDVKVGKAELVEGEGIRIRNISIVDTQAAGNHPKLIEIDEIFLSGDINVQDLLQGAIPLKQIKVSGAKIYMTRRADGSWSTSRLVPLPKFSDNPSDSSAEIVIENSQAEILDPTKSPAAVTSIHKIALRLSPKKTEELQTQGRGASIGRWYDVAGEFSCEHFRSVEIKGKFNGDTRQWEIAGKLESLDVSSRLQKALPQDISRHITFLDYIQGQTSVEFKASHDPLRQQAYQFNVDGTLTNCRINDPRLPYPITDVQADFHCDQNGYIIRQLQARIGSGEIYLACQGAGYQLGSPVAIAVKVNHFMLHRKYLSLLPESSRSLWYKFNPAGMVDADLKLTFDGNRWQSEGKVTCRGTSFAYHRLPYPLQNATGTLELKNNILTTNLTAYAGERPVKITGQLFNPGPTFTAWTEIHASHLPIDRKVLNALPEKTRRLLESFRVSGQFDIQSRFEKTDPHSLTFSKHAFIKLHQCSVNYEKFPYVFRGIEGKIEMKDKDFIFHNLNTKQITCNGYWTSRPEGNRLDLFFDAQNVPLDQKLLTAVPSKVRKELQKLRLQGVLDLIQVDLHYLANHKKLEVKVVAKEFPNSKKQPSESISIQPEFFPYRMDHVTGIVTYQAGKMKLQQFKATHGKTRIAAEGEFLHTPAGDWRLTLNKLQADHFRLDRDYLSAIPESASKGLAALNLDMPISVRGAVSFSGSINPAVKTTANWDLTASLQQASIEAGVNLTNIHGAVRIVGGVGQQGKHHSLGIIDFDAMTFKDFQFTEVKGPFEIREDKILFGSQAKRLGNNQKPQSITAKIYDGLILADCAVSLESSPAFILQVQLTDADLKKIAKQAIPGKQKLKGRVLASLYLTGSSRGTHTLRGKGKIRLRDADIYELPLMVSMLKILTIRLPDSTGFTSSDIDYRISGEHIYFDRINFHGDAVSLLGKGEMDMDQRIKLYFYSVLGNDKWRIPILRPLLGETSQQIMQIKVDGTLRNPQTTSEAFPAAKQLLKQLQAEFNISSKKASPVVSGKNTRKK